MTTDITELAQSLKAAAEHYQSVQGIARYSKTADAKERFLELANPANIIAMVEALEKAQRANGYLREQSAEWERKAISNFEDCAEMSARVEELESQRKLAFTASNRWADKFREAEKRIAELESRTVKMPEPFKLAKSSSGLTYYYADEVNEALSAAGIKWEAE
ncbi:hypothetical protein [Raoultella ornithinolytica]|uniref:hypothetical protein n=1 Tax=Raoultella ornithinolytica TaxID=54291 RepID=UPI002478C3F9|nr:hypothetical protein [Raoultella ornithinolytica]MDH7612431.1 hypothetical protein [Raoultella ornithinolytica]